MKIIILPEKAEWESLCRRPSISKSDLEEKVRDILKRVKSEKDKAVYDYSEKFDGVKPGNLKVSEDEIDASERLVSEKIKQHFS